MSLVPPAPPEPSSSPAAFGSTSTLSSLALATSQSNGALVTTSDHTRGFPSLSSMDAILRANGSATISFLTTIPNVKKWANVLTFRQSSSSSSPSGASSSATPPPPDRPDDKALGDPQPSSSASARSIAPSETKPGTVQLTSSLRNTPPIDQTSLIEAIASVNQGLLGLPEPDLQRGLQQHPQAEPIANRVVNTGQNQVQGLPLPIHTPAVSHMDAPSAACGPSMGPPPIPSSSLHALEPDPGNPTQEEKTFTLEATPSRDEKQKSNTPTDAAEETPVAPAPPIPLQPPEAFFVPVSVHLEDPETRALRMRRAYHMSVSPMHEGGSVTDFDIFT